MDIRKSKAAEVFVAAWTDAAFRDRLMASPLETLQEYGFNVTQGMKIEVMQNTDEVHYHVIPAAPWVVPTHLTLFPYIEDDVSASQKNLADFNVDVWTDGDLKEKFLEDPAATLADLGVDLPAAKKIEVLENTAQKMYLALPCPPDLENLSDAEIVRTAEEAVAGVALSKLY